jgi:hypothetical protein
MRASRARPQPHSDKSNGGLDTRPAAGSCDQIAPNREARCRSHVCAKSGPAGYGRRNQPDACRCSDQQGKRARSERRPAGEILQRFLRSVIQTQKPAPDTNVVAQEYAFRYLDLRRYLSQRSVHIYLKAYLAYSPGAERAREKQANTPTAQINRLCPHRRVAVEGKEAPTRQIFRSLRRRPGLGWPVDLIAASS